MPRYLHKLSIKNKFKFIHLSTDGVFSGGEGKYKENDFKNADDIYGRTKALGEVNKNNLTVRTSIIGPEIKDGIGLFHWFFKQKKEISGYANVFWTGITTLELAKKMDLLIRKNILGIVHLVPENKISKYQLLKLMKDTYNKKISIKKDTSKEKDRSLISTRDDTGKVGSYEYMLKDLKIWMQKNKELYNEEVYSFLKGDIS